MFEKFRIYTIDTVKTLLGSCGMSGLPTELNVEGSFIIITNAYGVEDSWSLVVTSTPTLQN